MHPHHVSPQYRIHLIAATLVGTLVWWTFPQDISSWRSASIVTGWIGCGLLLSSLFLMIREPWLAAWLGGLEPMYLWHHRFGVGAYLALLVHPLALAADEWGESATLAWSAISPWQEDWPVWLGWASLLCMMAGLVVSMLPRVPYAAWRKLHHLLTISVVFGGAHLVVLGLDWPLIWAPLLAILLLLWRILRADYGWAAKPYAVSHTQRLGPDMVEVSLLPLAKPVIGQPGQFVLVAFFRGPHFQGCGEYHPYTISAIHSNGALSLGIKALGDCTRHLQLIESGVSARVQGPFGTFLESLPAGPCLWVAGGIGITPFLAVLRSGPLAQRVHLLYLHRNESDAAYSDELSALAKHQPLLHLVMVDCANCLPDLQALLPVANELLKPECYLCGPNGLVNAAVAVLRERGVGLERIHFERFDFR
jgi:predicted ferric reductase